MTRPPASAAVDAAPRPGAVRVPPDFAVAGLEIVEELGRGAGSVVYRVRHDGTVRGAAAEPTGDTHPSAPPGGEFALKVMRSSAVDDERAAVAFRREASLVACVDHPGVPDVYEVGDVGGRPYLVMELVAGRSLAGILGAGRLDPASVVALAMDVAGALAAAHRIGVVHRDVKPRNIVVSADGRARLIDFGLATQRGTGPDPDQDRGAGTGAGAGVGVGLGSGEAADAVAGTVAYAAPEQTGMLRRPVDGRADLYALGVVLFECLAGVAPFVADDPGELVRLHATATPPDLRRLRPDVPPTLAGVVAKLLAKDPDDRYQSGDGLVADLRRISRLGRGGAGPAVGGAGAGGRDPGPDPVGPDPVGGGPVRLGGHDSLASATWRPIVGRRPELAQLSELWRRIQAGVEADARGDEGPEDHWYAHSGARGSLAVVEGPLGIGKTRLVEEFLDAVAATGAPVLTAACSPNDPAPLAVLRAAVDHFVQAVEAAPDERRATLVDWLRRAAGPAAPLLRALSPALAGHLHTPELDDEEREEQFVTAVAMFLTGLARAAGGAVLHLDGAGWLDPVSRRVVRQLAAELADVPLLLVLTCRTGPGTTDDLRWLGADGGAGADLRLLLGPLRDHEVEALARPRLGGAALDAALRQQLTTRVRGNPRMVLEYLRAMVDEGVIRPSWGTWILDEAALDRLDLPSDVRDLVVRRIDGLSAPTRRVLTAAAVLTLPFWPGLLAQMCGVDRWEAIEALQEAAAHGVVAGRPGGLHVFLHDLLPAALLAGLGPGERRGLHRSAAAALEAAGLTGPGVCYETARQYTLGAPPDGADHGADHGAGHRAGRGSGHPPEYRPDKAFEACYRAGRLALAEHAAAEALTFLEQARAAAAKAGTGLDGEFHRAVGVALLRLGRYGEARRCFDEALTAEPEALRRAEILGLSARAYQGERASAESVRCVERALVEIGAPLPGNRVVLLWSTLRLFLAGIWVGGWLSRRFGTADPPTQRRYRLQLHLLNLGARGAAVGGYRGRAALLHLRSLYLANRVGAVPEYVRLRAALGSLAHGIGWRRRAGRLFGGARRIAELIADPRLVAHVDYVEAMARDVGRGIHRSSGAALREMLDRHGRWLDPDEYLYSVGVLSGLLVFRGYASQAQAWHERAGARVAAGGREQGTPFAMAGVMTAVASGADADSAERFAAMRRPTAASGPQRRLNLVMATLHAGIEQGDFGPEFHDAVAELRRLRPRPWRVWPAQRVLWVFQAFALLAYARAASGDGRRVRLVAAERALRELRRTANTPLLRAYLHCARGSYAQLVGDTAAALRHLARAERLGLRLDVPWLAGEIATVRARALAGLGERGEARRQARQALMLAAECGLRRRQHAITVEFDVSLASAETGYVQSVTAGGGPGGLERRRLAALQQVSLAAATVLEPRELARVALDELLRILGAERAFLFLTDEVPTDERGQLRPCLGRDAAGADLDRLTGYSATLVERVRQTREALVVTGSEQGAALGSESMAVHGLRSIMVAPLQLKGRLLGVVYLDNRVAMGVFTVGDVDILAAIAHLVAASLETARAAQLELVVQAAQRQQELAELMRASIVDISATLDPDEVLLRLVATLTRVLPTDIAYVVGVGPGGVTASAVTAAGVAADGGAPVARSLGEAPEPALAALLADGAPTAGSGADLPAQLAPLLPDVGSWLAIPLVARSRPVGLLVIGSRAAGEYGGAHLKIAAALAGQGMIAYQNADLFAQVEQLATVDVLCDVSNRRHFLDLAARHVAVAARQGRPLAAVMLDIDHFKLVNDTHGHRVGDEVIRAVAARIKDNLRGFDIVGRYGGEEFAIVLPETGDELAGVVERMRGAVASTPVPTTAGQVAVTVSIGTARLLGPDDSLEALLARADEALYRAKHAGRDQTVHG